LGDEGLVLGGEVGDGGHGGGGAGEVGDEGVVVAGPEEDGGRVGLDGEGGLRVGLSVTETGIAEDELIDLLLGGGGADDGDGVGDVVEGGSGTARFVTCTEKSSRPVVEPVTVMMPGPAGLRTATSCMTFGAPG